MDKGTLGLWVALSPKSNYHGMDAIDREFLQDQIDNLGLAWIEEHNEKPQDRAMPREAEDSGMGPRAREGEGRSRAPGPLARVWP